MIYWYFLADLDIVKVTQINACKMSCLNLRGFFYVGGGGVVDRGDEAYLDLKRPSEKLSY